MYRAVGDQLYRGPIRSRGVSTGVPDWGVLDRVAVLEAHPGRGMLVHEQIIVQATREGSGHLGSAWQVEFGVSLLVYRIDDTLALMLRLLHRLFDCTYTHMIVFPFIEIIEG